MAASKIVFAAKPVRVEAMQWDGSWKCAQKIEGWLTRSIAQAFKDYGKGNTPDVMIKLGGSEELILRRTIVMDDENIGDWVVLTDSGVWVVSADHFSDVYEAA